MLKIGEYIESDFALVVQDDGHIVNPNNWSDEFLAYDYIGAPWPSSRKWNKRWKGENRDKIISSLSKNRATEMTKVADVGQLKDSYNRQTKGGVCHSSITREQCRFWIFLPILTHKSMVFSRATWNLEYLSKS